MKRFASFLMILVLTMSFTWSRASIPDTKENSKTEKLKEVSVTMVKQDLNFSSQKEFLFVNQNYSDLDYVVTTDIHKSNFTVNKNQKLSKEIEVKKNPTIKRNPRDGLSWQNIQVR